MWTREQLKTNAKALLRIKYWPLFGLSFILFILGAHGGVGNNSRYEKTWTNPSDTVFSSPLSESLNQGFKESQVIGRTFSFFGQKVPLAALPAIIIPIVVIALIILILYLAIGASLQVGCYKIYLEALRTGDVNWSYMGHGFKNNWGTIVLTYFLTDLFIFLGFLCFIVPGVILYYRYRLVPYILANEPDLTTSEVMAKSKEITDGEKFNIFVLDLSFIGWYLLASIPMGLGLFFLFPYLDATYTGLYLALDPESNHSTFEPAPAGI